MQKMLYRRLQTRS